MLKKTWLYFRCCVKHCYDVPALSVQDYEYAGPTEVSLLGSEMSSTGTEQKAQSNLTKRLRWSRGSVLAFGTQVRGFKPGRSRRILQGEKILSTPSFGREVKPFVPCRRFTACKKSLNVTWKSTFSGKIHRPFLAQVFPPFTTRVSAGDTWRCK